VNRPFVLHRHELEKDKQNVGVALVEDFLRTPMVVQFSVVRGWLEMWGKAIAYSGTKSIFFYALRTTTIFCQSSRPTLKTAS